MNSTLHFYLDNSHYIHLILQNIALVHFQIPPLSFQLPAPQTKYFLDQTLPGGQASGTYQATIPAQNTIMWFLICDPNPDWEEIDFTYDPALTSIIQVDIWTTSFDHTVGGEFIGVDSTALLVTGAQMNAAWMIPVIVSAIGIGIVIARKF